MQPFYASLWARAKAFALDYLVLAAYIIVLTAITAAIGSAAPGVVNALFGTSTVGHLTSFLMLTLPVSLYFALYDWLAGTVVVVKAAQSNGR